MSRLWDWMTSDNPRVYLPTCMVVGLSVSVMLAVIFSWAIASWQIETIESTRVEAAQACRDQQILMAFQYRASRNNATIQSYQSVLRYPVVGSWLVPPAWGDVPFISIPGAPCPELS